MTMQSLIESGKYDWVNQDITKENFSNESKPEKGLVQLKLKIGITSEEAIDEMKKQGYRPATLTELLIYGKENPAEPVLEKGEGYIYIVALGSVWRGRDGDRRVPYLYRPGAERYLRLIWFGYDWDARCRFAAVPASILLSKRQEWVEPEVCVCAAILAEDSSVYRGHRHGDCFRAMKDEGKMPLETSDSQGFMTTRNRFVTREEGRKLQDAAGIPSADKDGYRRNTLFSEDLYQADRDVLLAHLKEQDGN